MKGYVVFFDNCIYFLIFLIMVFLIFLMGCIFLEIRLVLYLSNCLCFNVLFDRSWGY